MLRRSDSFCLLPLLRCFDIVCKSKSFLFHSSQSLSSSACFTDRALLSNSIQNPITVDAFGDIFKEMLRREPLPPAKDFASLFGSAVERRKCLPVIPFIRDFYSSVGEPDVNIMNILINCFCQLKHTDLGFSTMGFMLKIGLKPDAVTLTTLINGLCREGKVDQAIDLSQHMEKKMKHQSDSDIVETIIDALCKDRFIPEALKLCLEMTKKGIEPTLVTYNCLLEGLCNSGRWNEASNLFIFMLQTRIMPDVATFNILAHALSQEGMVLGVKIIMSLMIRTGLQPNKVTFTALIYGYCSQNQMNDAMEALNLMVERRCSPDIVAYNSLIFGFCKTNNIPVAADLIREMLHLKLLPDIVTWNTFIHWCFRMGEAQAAVLVGSRLCSKHAQISKVHTHNIILNGLFKCQPYAETARTFRFYEKINMDLNIVSYNIVLHEMCKYGKLDDPRGLDDPRKFFSRLPAKGLKRDIYSYTIMINDLCREGLWDEAEELLINMEQHGCLPDGVTYNVLIRGLSLDVARTVKYLQIMRDKRFYVDPTTIDGIHLIVNNIWY